MMQVCCIVPKPLLSHDRLAFRWSLGVYWGSGTPFDWTVIAEAIFLRSKTHLEQLPEFSMTPLPIVERLVSASSFRRLNG